MSATRELIAALVAGGMDAASAAGLVARAAVEMTAVVNRKSAGAVRQQRYRDRNKASPSVTGTDFATVTNRHESVTPQRTAEPSPSVTNRNEPSRCDANGTNPSYFSLSNPETDQSVKKESKKEGARKKRNAPLPEGWTVPRRAIQIAAELGLAIEPIEARFRDYLASSGKQYVDYDAGFCNFVRNTPNFNGGNRGQQVSQYRADQGPGRATGREAVQLAAMGRGAARRLEERASAGRDGQDADGMGSSDVFDLGPRSEITH